MLSVGMKFEDFIKGSKICHMGSLKFDVVGESKIRGVAKVLTLSGSS
jgi:hypothetical protein